MHINENKTKYLTIHLPHCVKSELAKLWPYITILAILILVTYVKALPGEFLSDDLSTIVHHPDLGNPRYFTGRPHLILQAFADWLTYKIFGLNPIAFRGVSILLHIGVTSMSFLILTLMMPRTLAFIAASVFAVHPLLSETVIWISARGYLFLSFFFLLSFYFYLLSSQRQRYYAYSIFFYICALLSSEKAFVLFLVFFGFEFAQGGLRRIWKKILIYPGISLLWLSVVFGIAGYIRERTSVLTNQHYQNVDFYNPLIQIPTALTTYLQLFVYPAHLSFYHSDFGLTWNNYIFRIILFSAFLLVFLIALIKNRPLFFWIGFFFIPLLPTLTPLKIAWVAAERYTYLGTLGLVSAVICLIKPIYEKKSLRPLLIILAAIITILLSTRTVIRTSDWLTADNLWLATGKTAPSDPKTHNNLGDYYGRHGDLERAETEFRRAIELQPNYADALHNLGNVLYQEHRFDEAERYYHRALSINPDIWQSYMALGGIYYQRQNYQQTIEYLLKTLTYVPDNSNAITALADAYVKNQQPENARNAYIKALQLDPTNRRAQQGLYSLIENTGK
ncbi:hypothetical protein A2154_03000 [Candidatus Gottesmanbacteria bacterium RBG_16_43_7]|uniref:Uncharacterized protein n=1 Tax=Candidatus Gottesmanbacteria bacterium RBG_16_43_7 TaxID=1798373 RepID=A0A1F5Z986_9BACT|nr:MAG: hypothetical protein A2154_03000 [Candidatus Gottesmanbacteria bacterium RBG_16_43_7]